MNISELTPNGPLGLIAAFVGEPATLPLVSKRFNNAVQISFREILKSLPNDSTISRYFPESLQIEQLSLEQCKKTVKTIYLFVIEMLFECDAMEEELTVHFEDYKYLNILLNIKEVFKLKEDIDLIHFFEKLTEERELNPPGLEGTIPQKALQIRTWMEHPETDFRLILRLNLQVQGIALLPKEIRFLSNLTSLDVSHNRLHFIPEEIQYLTHLKTLILQCNQLKSLLKEVDTLQDLSILDLSRNKLKALPETLGNLTKLQQLHLAENPLEIIPANLGSPSLTFLSVWEVLSSLIPERLKESPHLRINWEETPPFSQCEVCSYDSNSISESSEDDDDDFYDALIDL